MAFGHQAKEREVTKGSLSDAHEALGTNVVVFSFGLNTLDIRVKHLWLPMADMEGPSWDLNRTGNKLSV